MENKTEKEIKKQINIIEERLDGVVDILEVLSHDVDKIKHRFENPMLITTADPIISTADPTYPPLENPYKVGDVVEYPSGYTKLPDIGTITKIYKNLGYVEIENNNDKTVAEVSIKDIKPYTEPICPLTYNERIILGSLHKRFRWLARDKDGSLYIYTGKPIKIDDIWEAEDSNNAYCFDMFKSMFKAIKWEDEQPCEFRKFV